MQTPLWGWHSSTTRGPIRSGTTRHSTTPVTKADEASTIDQNNFILGGMEAETHFTYCIAKHGQLLLIIDMTIVVK